MHAHTYTNDRSQSLKDVKNHPKNNTFRAVLFIVVGLNSISQGHF